MTLPAMFNLYYPLLIALVGFGVAMVLSERAIALLPADTKSALIDAFAHVRWLNFFGVALFFVLLLWRVRVAWIALALEYTALSIWSASKVHRLKLPEAVAKRLITAMLARSLGLAICAVIYVVRLSW
jgi:hypothetical protein